MRATQFSRLPSSFPPSLLSLYTTERRSPQHTYHSIIAAHIRIHHQATHSTALCCCCCCCCCPPCVGSTVVGCARSICCAFGRLQHSSLLCSCRNCGSVQRTEGGSYSSVLKASCRNRLVVRQRAWFTRTAACISCIGLRATNFNGLVAWKCGQHPTLCRLLALAAAAALAMTRRLRFLYVFFLFAIGGLPANSASSICRDSCPGNMRPTVCRPV